MLAVISALARRRFFASLVLLMPAAALGATPDQVPEAARELEGRLLAPCCYRQTLDIHASPLADEVRAEIRSRVARGDAITQIEQDLVARYGEKVRALPRAGFLDPYGIALLVGSGLALAALVVLGRRRLVRSRGRAPAPARAATAADREQLAHELADLD